MENREKFEKLMQDEDFLIKILELQTNKEVKAEFEKNGVNISEKEVEKLSNEFGAIADTIDEEDLSEISGGDRTWQDVKDKAWDKFGEGLGQAAWIIPTIALTTVVSTVVKWWTDRKLKEYEKKYDKKDTTDKK